MSRTTTPAIDSRLSVLLARIADFIDDAIEDYSEREEYFANNDKPGASRWNGKMARRATRIAEKLSAYVDPDLRDD